MLQYPQYGFTEEDVSDTLVRFVRLDNPDSYPFDSYHSHSYNEMLYFSKGGGVHNISFNEHFIEDHSLHLLSAGDLHWVERSLQSEGFALVYKDAFLHKLQMVNPVVSYLEYFSQSRVINLNHTDVGEFQLLLDEIRYNASEEVYLFNIIGALFTKLAIHQIGTHPDRKNFADATVRGFFELLTRHGCERLKLAEYARLLHVSPATLSRKLLQATGKTVNRMQQEFTLKEAKRLLLQTELPASQIYEQLGFLELAQFSNWFKKKTGVSPQQFRC